MAMTRRQVFSRRFPLALAAAAALMLAGCGGGGSSDVAAATAPGTLSGQAVKGPVSGAAVRAFAVSGGTTGAQVASAVTDANGAFTMPLGSHAGPMLLQVSGGSYTDEATGRAMAMGAGDMMTAVVPAGTGSALAGIQVTPLTAMAQAMAQHMAGGLTDANIAAANAAVGRYFMVDDILHTPPMNPLVSGSGAGASQATMNYGMTLAAMSQYAQGTGMPASSGFVTAMMNDASDGVLDGRAAGTPVAMGGGMMGGGTMGGGMMEMDAGRVGLALAMIDFMNSTFNRSGVTAAAMTSLMQQLRDGSGHLR
jgi:hypothetical protein